MVSLISNVCFLFFALITVDARAPARILEGTEAEPEKFPWMVSLQRYGVHVCGGALVGDSGKYILTAAHCFVGRVDPPYTEGLQIITNCVRNRYSGTSHKVKKVTPHPDFERGTKSRWRNDIAVIELEKPVTINHYVRPIGLPTQDTPHDVIAMLSGWGQTSYRGEESDRLQYRMVHVISNDECNKKDADVLDTNMCGFNGKGTGFCGGDSGSPLVHNGQCVGVVSFAVSCGLGYPDTYTRVWKYNDWINKTMTGS